MESNNPSILAHEVRDQLVMEMANLGSDALLTEFTEVVPSVNADENYPFMGGPPAFVELTDEVADIPASDANVNLINREFMLKMVFKKKDIEDDRRGIIRRRISDIAAEISDQRRQLVLDAIVANGTGYDGAAFFADVHPARGQQTAAQDNSLAGTGTTTAAVSTDIASAIAALMGFRDERNRTINRAMQKMGVIAHPSMRRAVLEALGSELISNTTNVGTQGIQWVPYFPGELTDTNDILVFNLSRRKPFLLQERLAAELDEEDLRSQAAKAFYARVRNASMLTHWFLGCRIVN